MSDSNLLTNWRALRRSNAFKQSWPIGNRGVQHGKLAPDSGGSPGGRLLGAPLATLSLVDSLAEVENLEATNRSPFTLTLEGDLPLFVTAMMIWRGRAFFSYGVKSSTPRGRLNALDRSVLGNWNLTADRISDVFMYTNLVAPFVLSFVDMLVSKPLDGVAGWGKDFFILLEVMAVTHMVSDLVKFMVRRPRPFIHDPNRFTIGKDKDNSFLSFFSGHTSLSFAMATAYSYLFTRRHPNSPLVAPVWVITHGLAAATAYLRVHAGKHFWTDVLTGAAVGSLIGFLVPWLHTRKSARPGDGTLFRMVPFVSDDGFRMTAMMIW